MGIKELAEKYNLEKSDFWEMKFGGKSNWIITHDACEKIADKEQIEFHIPQVFRDTNSIRISEVHKDFDRWANSEEFWFDITKTWNIF